MKGPLVTIMALAISCLFYSCNNSQIEKENYKLGIIPNSIISEDSTSGISYVLLEVEGKSYIIDQVTTNASDMAQNAVPNMVQEDILNCGDFPFGKIQNFIQHDDDSTMARTAVAEECSVNNKGEVNLKYNVYNLTIKNGKVEVLKEKYFADWDQKPKLVDREIIYPRTNLTNTNKQENRSKTYVKILTYKFCECNDFCYSSFIDEQGTEYNFGDLSGVSRYDFQCYPNNSDGGVDDSLKERNFKVEIQDIPNPIPADENGPGGLEHEIISIELLN
jgi:hypothetical protein